MSQLVCQLDNGPVANIFNHCYQQWVVYRDFHENLGRETKTDIHPKIISDNTQTGIGCYWVTDVEKIFADPYPVVAIDNLTESINSLNFFRHYPRDKYYIIFSNGYWDEDFYDLPFRYNQVYFPYFLMELTHKYLSHNRFMFNMEKTYDFSYPKEYNFISTPGSPRLEKDGFIERLLGSINYKNFVLKYGGKDLGMVEEDYYISQVLKQFNANKPMLGLERYFFSLSDTLPIDLYNKGYFNLLLEGDIGWAHQFHMTEKTVKTLATGMPFVAVSSPDFLKKLKLFGFRTYDELWDESYDDVIDYAHRMEAVVDLCNNLEQFDWVANRQKLIDIANHNRANFFNLNRIADASFRQFEAVIDNLPVDLGLFKHGI